MPTNEAPLMLIPAAGYGRRVGSPPAKELMAGPSGEPMIMSALGEASQRGWPALVITRSDKTALIQFLEGLRSPLLKIMKVGPTRDWPDTLLQSEPHWRARNLVVLPDTEWSPLTALDDLDSALESSDVAFASHEVPSEQTWGVMRVAGGTLSICEKPPVSEGHSAWGIFGFRSGAGSALLRAQSASSQDHQWRQLPLTAVEVRLAHFRDLTRP